MTQKRISRIQVKKLFDTINYDIDLHAENPISILIAPNGRGKTTILNILSFIFKPEYESFYAIKDIPFEEFRCTLSNGKTIVLKQKKTIDPYNDSNKRKSSRINNKRNFLQDRTIFEVNDFRFEILNKNGSKAHSMVFSEALAEAFKTDFNEFIVDADQRLSYVDRSEAAKLYLMYIWKLQIQYLEDTDCNIPVNFIKADRIQTVIRPHKRRIDIDEAQENPLDLASKRICELIKAATEKYSEAVSQAKDKLPLMFLDEEGSSLDFNSFMNGWVKYRNDLTQFQNIGLIAPTEDFTKGKDIANVYKDKGKFLSTYLSAFKDTTEPLQDIYERLNLFKRILDERNRITGKKIIYNRDKVRITTGNREINLKTLSSGEKHDFIMFYNLIFNVQPDGLVLIDEPEISLHIEWQETYLDRLIEICEMNGLQAFVATHSPNIVSSHYDFFADKGETDEPN